MNYKFKKGFTLIELLVVIAIIGVLASFLIANFVSIRERARDGKRKSDIYNIQAALEIFRSDKGSYPSSVPTQSCGLAWVDSATYISSMPCDPLNTGQFVYTYTYDCKGPMTGTYCLVACLENTSDAQKDEPSTTPCDDTDPYDNRSFTLKNP